MEDDDVVREVLGATFEEEGWKVEHATSCEAMARMLRKSPNVEVVVVDRHLPDGDGWACIGELRQKRSVRGDIVVIATTAHLALSNAERALVAGCEAFLEKPCEPRTVIEEALRLLGSRDPKTTTRRRRLRDT